MLKHAVRNFAHGAVEGYVDEKVYEMQLRGETPSPYRNNLCIITYVINLKKCLSKSGVGGCNPPNPTPSHFGASGEHNCLSVKDK